ncbi:MAG: hypothetical protein SO131_07280 [Prevotella sp.]|nr:hypothetical protein [Prevotella sp.]MDD6818575.1 hypothetical protein [Prevotellaceae bacterium]MCI6558867.1 hypothetical protein [Prevotella sp.]MCI7046086.1 hypothetical protein [Prevotella sp.]MDD6843038.1 hypothetical protein [Prevotellaceae bacterium]
MTKEKRHLRFFRYFFLLLFAVHFGSITLFTHKHVVNGVIIVHSHIHKGDHTHPQTIFETIFFLSKIVSYGDCTLPVIPSLALPLIGMLRMVPPVEHLKAALLRHFSLRAPPAMV